LEYALASGKPVLAICYGIQSLNVFLGGSLIQDIPSEIGSKISHSPTKTRHSAGREVWTRCTARSSIPAACWSFGARLAWTSIRRTTNRFMSPAGIADHGTCP